jgi:hypothetical protein
MDKDQDAWDVDDAEYDELFNQTRDYSNWRQLFNGQHVAKENKPRGKGHKYGKPVLFDDEKKAKYFAHLEKTGRKMVSALYAGVNPETINVHRRDDPDFKRVEKEVLQIRAENIVKTLEQQAMRGQEIIYYDKDGNMTGKKRQYETPMRQMMMKRYDPKYQETTKSKVDVSSKGKKLQAGVVVVPAAVSMEEWEQMYADKCNGSKQPPPEPKPS